MYSHPYLDIDYLQTNITTSVVGFFLAKRIAAIDMQDCLDIVYHFPFFHF